MNSEKAKALIEKYNKGECSPEEIRLIEEWENALEATGELASDQKGMEVWGNTIRERILNEIRAEEPANSPQIIKRIPLRWWMVAAACILLVISLIIYWAIPGNRSNEEVVNNFPAERSPGKEGAILTLADGKTIILDTITNGIIASQKGISVKVQAGRLIYEGKEGEAVFNTMSTPRGRQYQLSLPDGTGVWLNAGSFIRFPTVFKDNRREVSITGEVYFEVIKNASSPFLVNMENGTKIEVLGTRFNVNAYNNENSINTTLLDGSVRIITSADKAGVELKPGQQAQVERNTNGNVHVLTNIDTEKVTAWKNGSFNFEGSTLEEVLRQIERWYDIKVVYNSSNPGFKFRGGMYRNVNFSDVLQVLKGMGVKYEWDGKTLTIL
jgi:ferric-dicitrate binding protein FerR (iron transport regulator)